MALGSATRIVRRRPLTAAVRRFTLSRQIVRTTILALLLLMPLLDIFRVDLAQSQVVFFWQRLPMTSLILILPMLTILPLGIFFVLATHYGRLFCSWACPQGAINEAATKSQLAIWGRRKPWSNRLEKRFPKMAKRRRHWWLARGRSWWLQVGRYAARLAFLPPLAAFALVSYLVAPDRLWGLMTTGAWTEPAALGFFALYGFILVDLVYLQELSCRVCFYGYLQSIVSYSQQTGVRRNPELKSACHGCSACRDSCFAGVDPRRRVWQLAAGTDLSFDECVSCGDCLPACDDVTSRRGVPLIMEMPPVVRAKAGRETVDVRR